MNPNRLKSFSLFLFSGFFFYVVFKQAVMPKLLQSYGKNALFFFAILIVSTLVFLIVPKDVLKTVLKTKLLRYIVGIACLVQMIMLLTISINVIVNLFYYNSIRIFFLIAIGAVIVILSKLSLEQIINLSASFYIFIPFLWAISYIFFPKFDFMELSNPSFSLMEPLLMTNTFFSTMFLFLNNESKKIALVSGRIVGFLVLLVEYVTLLCLAGDKYFADYEYVGFIIYQIQNPNRYIGNFDFISIITLTVCAIFNGSYLVKISTICFKQKQKRRVWLIFIVITLCSLLTANLSVLPFVTNYMIIYTMTAMGLLFIYVVGDGIAKYFRRV